MEKKVLLTIAYDGTDFFGWQKQKDPSVRTVEGEMGKCLSKLFKTEIELTGASRTDRGVHALGQRATIVVNTTMPIENMPSAMNSVLPRDISVVKAEEAEKGFHPRFDAKNKTYVYTIYNSKIRNPLYRNMSEQVRWNLDVSKMKEAAGAFIGTHDFKGFCFSGNSSKTTVRTIFSLDVYKEGDFIKIEVNGDGFLYNMVRIIAGTLIQVGAGKIDPKDMKTIIESCDRSKAGHTAGPSGLVLKNIEYS